MQHTRLMLNPPSFGTPSSPSSSELPCYRLSFPHSSALPCVPWNCYSRRHFLLYAQPLQRDLHFPCFDGKLICPWTYLLPLQSFPVIPTSGSQAEGLLAFLFLFTSRPILPYPATKIKQKALFLCGQCQWAMWPSPRPLCCVLLKT